MTREKKKKKTIQVREVEKGKKGDLFSSVSDSEGDVVVSKNTKTMNKRGKTRKKKTRN